MGTSRACLAPNLAARILEETASVPHDEWSLEPTPHMAERRAANLKDQWHILISSCATRRDTTMGAAVLPRLRAVPSRKEVRSCPPPECFNYRFESRQAGHSPLHEGERGPGIHPTWQDDSLQAMFSKQQMVCWAGTQKEKEIQLPETAEQKEMATATDERRMVPDRTMVYSYKRQRTTKRCRDIHTRILLRHSMEIFTRFSAEGYATEEEELYTRPLEDPAP